LEVLHVIMYVHQYITAQYSSVSVVFRIDTTTVLLERNFEVLYFEYILLIII
jgi:hypothetical protein